MMKFYFLVLFLWVIESGLSEDNSIETDLKVKKLKDTKKDTKDQKKLLQKKKAKLLNKEQNETSTTESSLTSKTTQGNASHPYLKKSQVQLLRAYS